MTTATAETSIPRKWLGALRTADPLLLLLRASLLALLVNSNDDAIVLATIAIVCLIALPRPAILEAPWFWAGLFVAIGARQLATWHLIDDHIVVTTYWCGALALGLAARDPRATLAASARFIIGSLFAFAAGWKLRSGQFLDGSFFRYSLLFDGRFETPARLLGGTSRAALHANHDGLRALDATGVTGELALREGPHNQLVAEIFTGWGVIIEATVAMAFLVPLRRRWAWLRHGSLLAFATTTYLVVPVGGFGTLLLVLGAAQATTERLRTGYYLGAIVLLLWAGIWPTLFG
jgi:hypothetical protein